MQLWREAGSKSKGSIRQWSQKLKILELKLMERARDEPELSFSEAVDFALAREATYNEAKGIIGDMESTLFEISRVKIEDTQQQPVEKNATDVDGVVITLTSVGLKIQNASNVIKGDIFHNSVTATVLRVSTCSPIQR